MFRLVFLYEITLNASKEPIELPGLNQVVSIRREVKIKKKIFLTSALLKLPCSPHLLISDSFIGAHKFSLFVAEVLSPLFVFLCFCRVLLFSIHLVGSFATSLLVAFYLSPSHQSLDL